MRVRHSRKNLVLGPGLVSKRPARYAQQMFPHNRISPNFTYEVILKILK